MTETVPIFTVTDEWTLNSSVKDSTPFDIVVGTIAPNGKELWLPNDPSNYKYGGGYSDGYSFSDVKESSITLPVDMSVRFTEFFKKLLIKRNWVDIEYSEEKYNCHWFAYWLDGQINHRYSSRFIDSRANMILRGGTLLDKQLKLGEIGVLGCVSQSFDMAYAEHSMIGLNGNNVLQVMGLHGAVAISPQSETIQHFREISDSQTYRDTSDFGLYIKTAQSDKSSVGMPLAA